MHTFADLIRFLALSLGTLLICYAYIFLGPREFKKWRLDVKVNKHIETFLSFYGPLLEDAKIELYDLRHSPLPTLLAGPKGERLSAAMIQYLKKNTKHYESEIRDSFVDQLLNEFRDVQMRILRENCERLIKEEMK